MPMVLKFLLTILRSLADSFSISSCTKISRVRHFGSGFLIDIDVDNNLTRGYFNGVGCCGDEQYLTFAFGDLDSLVAEISHMQRFRSFF